MSHPQSKGRLISSHSQNSVLYSQHDADYDFEQHSESLPSQNIIFNQSFYKQKQFLSQQQQGTKQTQKQKKKQFYLSLDFVKKYFQSHSIEPIVTKTLKAILDTDYLPENPYNTLYRLLMPDTLLINSLHFYKNEKSYVKKINLNIKSLSNQEKNTKTSKTTTEPWMEQILTKRVQIADKQFFIGAKMARYIHPNALYIIWTEIVTKHRMNTISELLAKHHLVSYFMSIGGPALLLLEGVSSYSQTDESVKLSLKVNEPLSLSSYANEPMLQLGYYITVPSQQPSVSLTNFCNVVIEESLQQMQHNPNEVYMFLTKLSVGFSDKQAIVEWSTSQLVHEKGKIVKQIVKLLLTQKCQLKTSYYVKSSKKMSASLFQDYFTLTKTYILISPVSQSQQMNTTVKNTTPMNTTKKSTKQSSTSSPTLSIYTPTPLSFMFEHFFVVPHYYESLDKAYGLNSIKNEHIFIEYRKEKFKKITNDIRVNLLASAARQLFFLSLYDMSLSSVSYQNVTQALNLVINNPLNLLAKTIHQLKTLKITLNPTASSLTPNNQTYLYQTLQSIQTQFYELQKESDSPYTQIQVGFQTLRKILNVLLTKEKFRVNVIKLLLDYAILSLRGIINSFLTIAWSLTNTLHQYITELDKSLGNQHSKTVIQSVITYNYYLSSIKSLPQRVLYIPEQVKRYKQQLGTTENQTRELIIAKYLQKCQLYQNVYSFYWQIVQGKKLNYPLSKLMQVIKINALKSQSLIMKTEINRLKLKSHDNPKGRNRISVNRINGIQVYEMSKGVNNESAFYSFSKDSLNDSALTQYKKFHQKFSSYFQQNIQNLITLLSGKAKYILSLKNLPFLNDLSQQSSGIYITTLYADLVIRKPLKKQELINILYNELTQFMENVDRDDVGVIGVYASWRNLGNASIVYHGDSDEVYAQTSFQSTSLIKFDYKRKIPIQQFHKFIQHCITAGKQIQIRLIYKDQKVIQSSNITFNIYFHQDQSSVKIIDNKNDESLKPLIDTGNWEDRVFFASKDIVEWGVMNRVDRKKADVTRVQPKLQTTQNSKQIISPSKTRQQASSKIILNSMKKILLEQQVLIQQLILQSDDTSTPQPHLTNLRLMSPSYTSLEQSHHHLLTLLYLLTYIKHDRRNRFEFSFILNQVSLVEYYLMEHCLKNDKFIFLEGLVVEVANLLAAVKNYLRQREDNLGTEWEILWVEKIVCRITGLVKMLMVNVTSQLKKYSLSNNPNIT